jgi:hypothetical protein
MLSQVDAFFVAYQERSNVLMQLGSEVEIKGELTSALLEETLTRLVICWPQLGRRLRRRLLGLGWGGDMDVKAMLQTSNDENWNGAASQWRNRFIDPFIEPPFQLLWIKGKDNHLLAFRAHHAVTDGQGFFYICAQALYFLALLRAGKEPPQARKIPQVTLGKAIKPLKLVRQGKFKSMLRYLRWMSKEASAGRGARIAVEVNQPGDIAYCERRLDKKGDEAFKASAAAFGLSPLWLCAAAWMRAINRWNLEKDRGENSLVSLEVPVSLRGKYGIDRCIGNFISPLVLFGDAARPIDQLGGELKGQFFQGVKDRSHMGMPFFSGMGKYLPWPLFRRAAVTTTASGFATSHFTWLQRKESLPLKVSELSGGALEMVDQHIYTPVCLHMGAALLVLVMPGHLQLFVTYRLNALPVSAANRLTDLLLEELGQPLKGEK